MANKKQKRMEQDPKVGTGKMKPKDLKPKPGVTIKIDVSGNIGDFSMSYEDQKRVMKDMEGRAKRIMEEAAPDFLFGKSEEKVDPGARGGGNIFVEGGDGRMRSWLGDMAKDPAIQKTLRDVMGLGGSARLEDKDSVARLIWSKAIEVWEHPINWQFMVVHNPGQGTYWFTAKYYDEEAETVIVEMTQEFTEDQLYGESFDSINLGVERALEDMHRKCEAEIAMFE